VSNLSYHGKAKPCLLSTFSFFKERAASEVTSSVVLLYCINTNSEACAKVLFGGRNFLSACSNSGYVSRILGRPERTFGSESTITVAKRGQLLWQVFIHRRVSKIATSLVGGDQIGW
jgi:hypothetical protein